MERNFQQARIGLRTKIVGLLLGVFLALSAVFIAFTLVDQRERTERELLETSRVLVLEMEAVWEFVSINQSSINYATDGTYDHKGLHCAIAGKSVAALFSDKADYSYRMRFTNLNPRNLYNEPDAYEADALAVFYADDEVKELYGFETQDGEPVFRYVSVMEVTDDCIECHGGPAGETDVTGYPKEGWEVGDIAGAVSVVVPAEQAMSNMAAAVTSNAVFFLLLMVLIGVIIYASLSRMITRPLERLSASFSRMGEEPRAGETERDFASSREVDDLFAQFDTMARRLSDYYTTLEMQVSDRTAQLREANEELERQRRHVEEVNERLSQDNRYKSDFLAIVSHELRTPLTSILAFTELLADNLAEGDESARRQLGEIQKNGAILLEMVENVLETARIQAGSEQLNLELVDLSDLVGMVAAANEPVALRKGTALETRVDGEVPLIVSDWEKLRRILTNLVSNAVKFTPQGGLVQVEATFDASAQTVRLTVRDTGIGIPADKHDLIFERFTQENMSTVRRYGGSGLGLSLVKDLVGMLGGSVAVESEVGVGSVFTVVLPSLSLADAGAQAQGEGSC